MNYVIIDLEATCWPKGTRVEKSEIIEIGAVMLHRDTLETLGEFSSFVKPTQEPVLSQFCKELTGIQQDDVDNAKNFSDVYKRFIGWIGADSFRLCSWGQYDLNQLREDCKKHKIPFPIIHDKRHINLKKEVASQRRIKACGMKAALQILHVPLDGQHHRGIDDARNIAKIAKIIIPRI